MRSVEPFLAPLTAVAEEYRALTGVPVDLPAALFLRAVTADLDLPATTSAGGSCHLLPTADGWAAVNLARPDDLASVPALLALMSAPVGAGPPRTPAEALKPLLEAARETAAADLAAAAQLLGIAAAAHGVDRSARPPAVLELLGESRPRCLAGLKLVDLSALWAGPLCARLLGLAGAQVLKVESNTRPDGARSGSPVLYDWLHEGHDSVTVDFASSALADVIADADLVIEASRPRALRRLGIHAEQFLAARPGRVWLSITGYGRSDDRIAFGDDAAVSAALTTRAPDGTPHFAGDALADPVTGIHAALAAALSLAEGGGHLISVSMSACATALTLEGT